MNSHNEPPTVLVVDDNRSLADMYQQQLRDDYDVTTAYSGDEALTVVDETVDVVLLDRRMPGLSGDDVLREIRDRELDCRVIMVSAISEEKTDTVSPDDYYQKPIQQDTLREAVAPQSVVPSR